MTRPTNAGRKPDYTEPTEVLSVRVPKSKKKELKSHIDKKLETWKTSKTK